VPTLPATLRVLSATPRDFHVLSSLRYYLNGSDYTPLKQVALGRALGLSQPAISMSLRRLRKRGYLEVCLLDDRRAYRLTEKAAA
jgi:DNA-binding MarR family transcriptional regulator